MKAHSWFFSLVVFSFAFCLSGCDKDKSEATQVLPKMSEYFPDSVIYQFDSRVLWIQTRVDGISSKTAGLMFENACQQAQKNIGGLTIDVTAEMAFDNKKALIIGFKHFLVAWGVKNGVDSRGVPRYEIIPENQIVPWMKARLGYVPSANQIYVVTLENALNTPKGQPMQTESLADLQSKQKQQYQDAMQDVIRKQELLKNP